jgi:hypothetical protein
MSHSDHRTIVVSDVGTKPSLTKQPDDVFDYLFDYSTWLGDDTTIASATSVRNPAGGTAPTIVSTTVSLDALGVVVRLSGGTTGYRGVITCTATMVDSEKKQAEFELLVKEVDYVAPA